MDTPQNEMLDDFTNKVKEELRELGLIKQEERLKITKNTKGFNYEYSLLGKVEDNLNRIEKLNSELDRRLL